MENRAPYLIVGSFVFAVIIAVFGFVYWLNNSVSIGRRTTYRIVFEGPVPGLLSGAAVLFNGIRVGEVTSLQLDSARPRAVLATVAVEVGTPMRKDTKVGLEFQGLTGIPVIAFEGRGDSEKIGEGALLKAELDAGQSMTQAARDALRRIDAILSENSGALRNTFGNLQTFSEGLARNTPRLDSILAGLERSLGAGPQPAPKATYDLDAVTFADKGPPLRRPLSIQEPTAIAKFQTQRFLLPGGIDQMPFANAQWSDSVPALLEAKLLQSFENYDIDHPALRYDGTPGNGLRLVLDVRKFEIESRAKPRAVIALSAKLLDEQGAVIASRIFESASDCEPLGPAPAAAAFNEAFREVASGVVLWVAERT